jgi:peptidoglycan/LPS O-acetylase OafA/YrhL
VQTSACAGRGAWVMREQVGAIGGARAVARPETIDALTGLRFIAAFSVLMGHAAVGVMTFEPAAKFTAYFTQGPAIGMPLFFVLSGFVIHYNYGAAFREGFLSATADFFIARFARLYPLYILLLTLYLLNHRLLPGILSGNYDISIFPRFLLLWQSWLLEYRGTTWFGHLLLPPAWSISVEVFFYALYPLIGLRCLEIKSAKKVIYLFTGLIAFYVLMIVECYLHFDALRIWGNETFHINADPQNALLGWLLNTGPIGRLFEFMMGVLCAQLFLVLRDRKPTVAEQKIGTVTLSVSIAGALVLYLLMRHNSFIGFAGSYPGGLSPLFAVIVFCVSRYSTRCSRLLGSKVMVHLGDASYSIYLIHLFTLQLFSLIISFPLNRTNVVTWMVTMLGAMGFTILLSLGLYRVFEAPSRVFLRRLMHSYKERIFTLIPKGGRLSGAQTAIMCCAVAVVFGAWNWPKPSMIEVVDATYGKSCKHFSPPAPALNTFRRGNATDSVKQACAGTTKCAYLIDVNRIGDPAMGCAKDFRVVYKCKSDPVEKSLLVPAEANGRTAVIDCDRGGAH